MGLKLKSTGGTGSVQLNAPDNHNTNTTITLPADNVTGGEFVLADGNGNVNIDSGTLYVDAVNDRVGVGTSSPSTNTEINAALDTGAGLALNEGQLSIGREADSGGAIRIGYDTTNNFGFISSGRVGVSWDNLTLNAGGGNVGIGTTSPSSILDIQTSSGNLEVDALGGTSTKIRHTTTGGILALEGHSGIRFDKSSADEMARFDSSGRLLVGTPSVLGTTSSNGYYSLLAVRGNTAGTNLEGRLVLATDKAHTSVTSGTDLGGIWFNDGQGGDYAYIRAQGDGTGSSSSFPGRLTFYTTPSGSTSPSPRLTIYSGGTTTMGISNGLFFTNLNSGSGTSTLKYAHSGSGEVTYDTSSILVKENIETCPYGLAEIQALKPRKYFRTDDQRDEIGFIADEVIDILPEFVPTGPKSAITRDTADTENIPLAVNYEKLTAVLTKALQEATARIETLEANNVSLEAKVTALETQNASFEARLAALEGGTTE